MTTATLTTELTVDALNAAVARYGRYVDEPYTTCDWCGEVFHDENTVSVEADGLVETSVLCTGCSQDAKFEFTANRW